MSEIAFCVLPWPSAYLKSVTLGHLAASSLPEAVVTSRQLLPPNPSSRAKLIFFVPHQSGAPSTWVTLPLALSPPLELPPQPVRVSRTAAAAAAPGRIVRTFIWTFLPVDTAGVFRRGLTGMSDGAVTRPWARSATQAAVTRGLPSSRCRERRRSPAPPPARSSGQPSRPPARRRTAPTAGGRSRPRPWPAGTPGHRAATSRRGRPPRRR